MQQFCISGGKSAEVTAYQRLQWQEAMYHAETVQVAIITQTAPHSVQSLVTVQECSDLVFSTCG